jgi:hypothetical protein
MKVRDAKTGEVFADHGDTDYHEITGEKWASRLTSCDMCCFAMTQCGILVLLDECGNYAVPPKGRFEVIPAPGTDVPSPTTPTR